MDDGTEFLGATAAAARVSLRLRRPFSPCAIAYHEAHGRLPALRLRDGRGRGTRMYRPEDVDALAETLARAQERRSR
jgi:hypothetical protein